VRTAIVNIRTIVTGDLKQPFASGDGILLEDGLISAIGTLSSDTVAGCDVVVDAAGTTAIPGLIDSHVHITFGDYTPRQRVVGYLESYLHGGTTTSITASEVHVPGRPKDAAGVKALALAARACFLDYRPGGMRVHAGSIILEPGLTEADLADLVAQGLWLAKAGFGAFATPFEYSPAGDGDDHAHRRILDSRLFRDLGRARARLQSLRVLPRQWRPGGDA
jgi:enamidase